ncbi:hypothetical protein [Vagococcus luciliae]|nr:hypothetical protein [Vagococcus luciliae]
MNKWLTGVHFSGIIIANLKRNEEIAMKKQENNQTILLNNVSWQTWRR